MAADTVVVLRLEQAQAWGALTLPLRRRTMETPRIEITPADTAHPEGRRPDNCSRRTANSPASLRPCSRREPTSRLRQTDLRTWDSLLPPCMSHIISAFPSIS